MSKVEPTSEQIKLARFLVMEDSTSSSPLFNKVYVYGTSEDYNVYNLLNDIQRGRTYCSEAAPRLNRFIKKLNDNTDGYIDDNWEDFEDEFDNG